MAVSEAAVSLCIGRDADRAAADRHRRQKKIAFGPRIVLEAGVSTITISERIDAGEAVDDVASDYDLSRDEIEEAVLPALRAGCENRVLKQTFGGDSGEQFL